MLNDYLAWGDGYGWHISDLRIYDAPRELSKFERPYACHEESKIKRAPQSWGYVQEVVRDE